MEKARDTGANPFWIAAAAGHLAMVQYLLDQGADKEKSTNNGYSPLYAAAQNGHLAVVQYLLEQGADVNKAANNDWTPLHAASSNGHAEVLTCLMDGGASLTGTILATDPLPDLLPIDVAANDEIVQLIRRRRAQQLIRRHTAIHDEVYPLVIKRNRRW